MFSSIHLGRVLRHSNKLQFTTKCKKNFSATASRASASGNLEVDLDSKTGVAVVKMLNKPANALDLDYLSEISSTLEELEDNRDCRALILTSALPGIFSAGLELTELCPLEDERFDQFWRKLEDVFFSIYISKLATMAAINGHAPAGGCLLTLCCDYRIMTKGKYSIGLNEAALGLTVPLWLQKAYTLTLGYRNAEKAGMLGNMFSSEKALHVGLVDQLSEPDKLLDDTQTEMAKWLKTSDVARQLMKEKLRRPHYNEMLAGRDKDAAEMKSVILREQKLLRKYIEQLKMKAVK